MEIRLKLKRNSLFLLYFLLISLALLLFRPAHLSTNMLAIFQHDENIEKLKTMNAFEQSSRLLVSIKGFSREHRDKLLEIEKELKAFPFVKKTTFNSSKIEITDYMKRNYYLLSHFTPLKLSEERVLEETKKLKEHLVNATFYTPIDKNDPFKLFSFNLNTQKGLTKNGYLALGEYGYLLVVELNTTAGEMKKAREIESKLSHYFADKKEVLAFSTLFFMAQNSSIIEANVHKILYLSFALLMLLFWMTLRDFKLLIANSITLASSVLFALGVSSYLFEELSIFVLAFGSAISSLSVDYLFHNYFHKQYRQKGINRSIMWGFLTTVLGFFMLQFVAFPLIAQLSVFAMLSLGFSYFQFTFLYPYFGFLPKAKRVNVAPLFKLPKILPVNAIFIFSLFTILYAGYNVEFDTDLRHLDYDNKPLKAKQEIVQNSMTKTATLLVEAKSFEELVERALRLKNKVPSTNSLANLALTQKQFNSKRALLEAYDFVTLKELLNKSAKKESFKEGYFKNAYDFVEHMPKTYAPKIEEFKSLGYEILKKENKFYTIATINRDDIKLLRPIKGISLIEAKELIASTMQSMLKSLLFYLLLAFLSIVVIIAFIAKRKTVLALNFILFPVAMILLYLSFFQINIMHLFSIIIIIVAGIDYGIYVSQENSQETNEAIFYSLLTSFSGFGILVLSNIGAIHSIGEVITVGIVSIFLLVIFLKNSLNLSENI